MFLKRLPSLLHFPSSWPHLLSPSLPLYKSRPALVFRVPWPLAATLVLLLFGCLCRNVRNGDALTRGHSHRPERQIPYQASVIGPENPITLRKVSYTQLSF